MQTGRLAVTLGVALYSRDKVRLRGSLLFVGSSGERHPGVGLAIISTLTAALPALNLALEVAPIRVNLIAHGFVDTPLSASLLGDRLEARREEVRARLPIWCRSAERAGFLATLREPPGIAVPFDLQRS